MGKITDLNPHTASIPATLDTLFLDSLEGKQVVRHPGESTSCSSLMDIMRNMSILTCCTHSERSIHMPLSQTSLPPIVQLCDFQGPDQSASPLAIATSHCSPAFKAVSFPHKIKCSMKSSAHTENLCSPRSLQSP